MNSVVHGYINDFVLVYLDDILIFSNNEDEHESHLHKVFDQLWEHNCRLNLRNVSLVRRT